MSISIKKSGSAVGYLASLTVAATVAWAAPVAAEISYTDISTDLANGRDRPRVDRDADGNYHIVYRMGDADTEFDSGMTGANVGYMMVAANGDVLIDETELSTDDTQTTASVDLEVTSDGKVWVVYIKKSDKDIRFVKLDPSLAPQDGTATTLATIEDVAETVLVGDFDHAFVELDANDDLHIWEQDGDYTKRDGTDGSEIVAINTPFNNVTKNGHGTNPIALDSDGNVHLIFQDCTQGTCPVSYAMLDGSDGSVLIDQTEIATPRSLSGDEAPHGVHYNVMVDSKDMVSLVWVDKRNTPIWDNYCETCASGGTAVYAKLDPSLDDQDGSAADIAAIKVVDDVELGPYKYVQAFMDKNNKIHVFHGPRGGMSYLRVNTSGGFTASTVLTSNAVGLNGWNKHYPAALADNGMLFWPAVDNSEDGVGTKIVMGKPKAASGGVVIIEDDDDGLFGGLGIAGLLMAFGAMSLRRRRA